MTKNHHLLGAVCACIFTSSISFTAHAAPISGQGTWESTLQGRDLDGNAATFEAYYDTTLDITWLADANINGQDNWQNQKDWAASLTLGGFTDWRLPTTSPIDGVSFNTTITNDGTTDSANNISRPGTAHAGSTASEMAHMFYNTLGNVSDFSASGVFDNACAGSCLVNTADFLNVQSFLYWSGSELDSSFAWFFHFNSGGQNRTGKHDTSLFAWAVHSGDVGTAVSAVPVPAAAWLLGGGLVGLLGVAKRKAVPAHPVLHGTRSS